MTMSFTKVALLSMCTRMLVLLMVLTAPVALATADETELPIVAPESVGLDPQRLDRLTEFLENAIADGEIAGAVVLVSRHGSIALYEALGKLGPADDTPMPKDAIFRIYSMTKPITALTVLRAVERGEISLVDKLSQYLPAFENMTVLNERHVRGFNEPELTRPALDQIVLFDLVRHAGGFGDETFYPGYVGEQFRAAGIGHNMELTLAEAVKSAAEIPLLYDPGTHFSYAETNFTVLGRVLEVVHDKAIDDIYAEDIFGPLGMVDTGFQIPADNADRLAQPIERANGPDANLVFDAATPRNYHSTANGLVSTALDYWRFVQMLLDDGTTKDGNVFLAPVSVNAMLTNSISNVALGYHYNFDSLMIGCSWGIGIGVCGEDTSSAVLFGDNTFFWVGYGGTFFLANRDSNFAMLVMIQQPDYLVTGWSHLYSLAMQSIVD
ncbi:MAG: serine hydrolase domain-containing protein [Pseudomonadota bacterium]